MATTTLVTCDGCDRRLSPPFDDRKIRVELILTVHGTTPRSTPQKVYDLCESCQDRLMQVADPLRWERLSKETARVS